MSVSTRWNNPQHTALLLTFTAPWTWDDFEQVSQSIESAFASVDHTVDLIIDVSWAGELPSNTLDRLRDTYADATSNLGCYIFVGATDAFKTLLTIADRYYTALGGRLDFRFADTLDEVLKIQ